jgi:hypothetical protein
MSEQGKIIIVNPNDKFTGDLDYCGYGNASIANELHKMVTTGSLSKHVTMGSKEWSLLNEVWSRLRSMG